MAEKIDIPALRKTLNSYVRRAHAYLYWERFAPVFALALAILAVFLTFAFTGIWERIGDPWRLIGLFAALGWLGHSIYRASKVKRPNRSNAQRRVETDSAQSHRPLDTIEDDPALSKAIWPVHLQTAMQSAQRIRAAKLRPTLAPMDKYYLRFSLPVILVLGLMVGAGDNLDRLRRALSPTWQSGIKAEDVVFEAWADPPEYTGRPPLYFKDKKRLEIPKGSELVARISGVKDAPRLRLKTRKGSRYLRLKRLGPESFETRAVLTEDATARWRVGSYEQGWNLSVLPDAAPVISFSKTPKADKRDRLNLSYSYEDDYGVEAFELEVRLLTEDPELGAIRKRIEIAAGSGLPKRANDAERILDLTQHEWAGKKVAGRLLVTDGMGQTGHSEEEFFTIPHKIFIEPLAKAIAENRQLLMAGSGDYSPIPKLGRADKRPVFDTYEPAFRLDRAPAPVKMAALNLDALIDRPEGVFRDPAVYLGLAHSHKKLRYAQDQAELTGMPDELWRIAIRAEFGVLGTALEDMRKAEQALRDGMARRAPEREIDTLFERYNEAVERYTEELRRKAIEEGNIADAPPGGGGGGQNRNLSEIEELLKAIEEANAMGDVVGARKALARLAELLENMEVQLTRGGGGGGGDPMPGELSEEMKKSLEELADLLGEQRELQDETRQAENEENEQGEDAGDQPGEESGESQGEGSGADGGDNMKGALTPGELAKRQQALQQGLDALKGSVGEAMDELAENGEGEDGNAPGGTEDENGQPGGGGDEEGDEGIGAGESETTAEALARAGDAMADSEQRLGQGDLAGAQQAQQEAIRALREAGSQLAESSRRSESGDQASAEGNEGNNPLGRSDDGFNDDESQADIDTRNNAKRARELREELRKRAAEQERNQSERDYLERLLKRF